MSGWNLPPGVTAAGTRKEPTRKLVDKHRDEVFDALVKLTEPISASRLADHVSTGGDVCRVILDELVEAGLCTVSTARQGHNVYLSVK